MELLNNEEWHKHPEFDGIFKKEKKYENDALQTADKAGYSEERQYYPAQYNLMHVVSPLIHALSAHYPLREYCAKEYP